MIALIYYKSCQTENTNGLKYCKVRSILDKKIDPNSPDEKFGTEFPTNELVPYG